MVNVCGPQISAGASGYSLVTKAGRSANYNIKTLSTPDLLAFVLYAITLNQERSARRVDAMHKPHASCMPVKHIPQC